MCIHVRNLFAQLCCFKGHKFIRHTIKTQVVLNTNVQVPAFGNHIYRPVPLVVGQQVQKHHFHLKQGVFVFGNIQVHIVRYQVGIFLRYNPTSQYVFFVHRNPQFTRRQVIDHSAVCQLQLGFGISHNPHSLNSGNTFRYPFVNRQDFIGDRKSVV